MQSTRRDFIKISSLGIAGLSAVTASAKGMFNFFEEETFGTGAVKKTPMYCEICFWQCAGWAHLDKDDKIVGLTGHIDDPHCAGRLCPRGTGGIGMYDDKDRLKTPLINCTNRV